MEEDDDINPTGPNSVQRADRKTRALARVYRNKRDNRVPLGGADRPKSKLSKGTILLMAIMVVIYETINGVLNEVAPVIGPFLSGIVIDLHFYLWFKMKGVSFMKSPKRALGWIGMLFFNEVEIVDEASLALGVGFTIWGVLKEEKLENDPIASGTTKKATLMKGGAPRV